MRSSKSSTSLTGGLRLHALVVGAAARPAIRLFSWLAAVARYSGLPGLLIVAGLLIWPVAVAVAWFGDGRTQTIAWSVAVIAGAVFLAGAFWRKSALRSARRRRRAIANARALDELQQLEDAEWVDGITQRRQAVQTGAIKVADPSIMSRRRRRKERRTNRRRISEEHGVDRRRGERRRSASITDADSPDSQ